MMKKSLIVLLVMMLLAAVPVFAEENTAIVSFSDMGLEQETEGVSFDNGVVRIEKPGTYVLSGTLTDGQIHVDVKEKGDVVLVLSGVEIHNKASAAIEVERCGRQAVISLAEGTENIISDGPQSNADPDEDPSAVLFSAADLVIEGSGSLQVTGGRVDGITSKDRLIIRGGKIVVEAVRHGIKGKDSVQIAGGEIEINAGKDGIKSTNKEKSSLGYVEIIGGRITIRSGDEPIQAETYYTVEDAKIRIIVNE